MMTTMVAVACLAAGLAVASGSPAGSAPTARVVPRAAPALNYRQLTGVSCVSTTACFVVGSSFYGDRGIPVKTLTARWNGLNWAIFPSPNSTKVPNNQLQDVSCTSTTNCFAVGYTWITSTGAYSTLVERWNGKNWSIVPSPNPSIRSTLLGVSCTSPTFCVAVGYQRNKTTKILGTLVEMWDGKTWSVANSPNPAGLDRLQLLTAISCATATSCVAVGQYDTPNGNGDYTLAERWNGKTWSIDPGLMVHAIDTIAMSGVSCTSATTCFTVGTAETTVLAARLSGKTWSTLATPFTGAAAALVRGLSCTSSTDCTAVGVNVFTLGFGTPETALVEHWDGTTWSIVADASPDGSAKDIDAVSCTSPTFCLSVGALYQALDDGHYSTGVPLIERWNGTSWLPVKSRNANAVPAGRA